MKTLMISTALALALGLSSGASALAQNNVTLIKAPALEVVLQTETSLVQATEFYQGDYLAGTKSRNQKLTQSDLYTGRGASAIPSTRWLDL